MCPRATAPGHLKKKVSTKRKPRSPERMAAQEGRQNKAVPDEADSEKKSQKQDGKNTIQGEPAWRLAGTLGQPKWEGFHPGCASLGTGGDSRTIRESEETRKSSKRRSKHPRKPQEKDRRRKRPSRSRVLRRSCVRSAYDPRTLHVTSRVCPAYDPLAAET